MSKTRLAVLLFGPLVIIGASAAGALLTSQAPLELPQNHVFLASVGRPGVAVQPETHRQNPLARAPGRSRVSLQVACRRTAREWQNELASWPGGAEQWRLICRDPFVIAGMMSEHELERWHDRVVRPAAAALSKRYFARGPTQPITLLLLPDEDQYRDAADWFFGDRDVAPFGYYRPDQRAVILNLATGAGTLVHELTHTLMACDFPNAPDWFNEGMAALYEECRLDPSRHEIQGLVNWRLPELQDAIRANELRPLEQLMRAGDFRGSLEGINYAQARYFCMYLQQLGVLDDFYRRFRGASTSDSAGARSLSNLFGQRPVQNVDEAFREWVLRLQPMAKSAESNATFATD